MVQPCPAFAEGSPAAVVLVDKAEARAAACFKTDQHGDARAVVIGTFPTDSHARIVHPVALGRDAYNPLASEMLAFLRTDAALRLFSSFGYTPAY